MNIDGTMEQQLTDDVDKEWRPIWLDDNETLFFYSDKGGGYDLSRFTPDGSRLIYRIPLGSRVYEWWIVDIETLVQHQITVPSPTIAELWLLPDGEHVVYEVWPEPEADVWLLEIEEGGGR